MPVVVDRVKAAGLGGSSTRRPPVVVEYRVAAGLTTCLTSRRPPVVVACSVAAGLTTCLATRWRPILAQWPKAAGLMGTLPARRHPVPPRRRLPIGTEATTAVAIGLLIFLNLTVQRRPHVAVGRSVPVP